MMAARDMLSGAASDRRVLVTGGAGFIGTNLADRLAEAGLSVTVYDNLSRAGVERNLSWLKARHGERIRTVVADIRDGEALREAVRQASHVFHFAAQVAVTTSLVDPLGDFAVNAQGTLNLLEAVRACPTPPPLLFTSTNKVYGALEDLALERLDSRYMPTAGRHQNGVDETRPLEFHSPYGCSKGAADQYVLDYARSYGLPAAVFRMSCIYGPHQCGNEDQGWVAHFLIRAVEGQRITLYGDGRQVRDILYVEDLIDAMLLAQSRMAGIAGQAFNIGGGSRNAVSLVELLDRIECLTGQAPRVEFGPWRTGDQRYYVSDHRAFTRATGWQPRVQVDAGVERLHAWFVENGVAGRPAAARRMTAASAATPAEARS